MHLPIIELASLPDLNTLTGIFGSLATPAQATATDNSVIAVMVFVYSVMNP
ncbi:MAG: hypothetical protein JSR96_00500 [Proteobacteria bacterium]|nr:hypothetical protein [Pseudomonadota bacterium]